MLGVHLNEESKESLDEESENEENTSFMLPHWSFIPGDRRYYLIIVKPMDSKLGITLNNEGKIEITVTHENLKEIQQMAAKCIGSLTNIFETRFENFTRKATITPTLPLRNEPKIHEKTESTISISFPIEEHNVAEEITF
jgi:hypothetical protein